ncbi:hypothetical protein BAUCODRAFT_33818 [Baudoinia panamericana UAMH 10762]|uniref:Uncharacterized protein n=1 Tax=Baudoinia panamericana (strain UAMH 10762) TaxID=717646 RepID=M2LPY0_BAUPA|nr:uncharacterized protein BAUCODRAFT_33818 [Baudoinia panamericana UAMH 10762]EMC96462.1 hypothetical protein BAUCODRAFT_33818 [Baudoinia panamericana UAMH 10762]
MAAIALVSIGARDARLGSARPCSLDGVPSMATRGTCVSAQGLDHSDHPAIECS